MCEHRRRLPPAAPDPHSPDPHTPADPQLNSRESVLWKAEIFQDKGKSVTLDSISVASTIKHNTAAGKTHFKQTEAFRKDSNFKSMFQV